MTTLKHILVSTPTGSSAFHSALLGGEIICAAVSNCSSS